MEESTDINPEALRVNALSKRYGRFTALDGVSFAVRRGECLGLLGPNGAGKSTLMSILSGLLAPSAGSVLLCGRGDPTQACVRAHLGLVSQTLALYPNLSAAENLALFGHTQGLLGRRLAERVRFALQLADLQARADERVRKLSGGMQRRLHLACALLHEPSLLLLDEPTAGVDPHSREHMFRVLQQLKADGLTMLYSTHLMEEAERLCERIAILDHGKLVALGSQQALIDSHGQRAPIAKAAAPSGPKGSLGDVFMNLTGHSLRDA